MSFDPCMHEAVALHRAWQLGLAGMSARSGYSARRSNSIRFERLLSLSQNVALAQAANGRNPPGLLVQCRQTKSEMPVERRECNWSTNRHGNEFAPCGLLTGLEATWVLAAGSDRDVSCAGGRLTLVVCCGATVSLPTSIGFGLQLCFFAIIHPSGEACRG